MGLLDSLSNSKLGLKGGTPAKIASANPASTLHFQSSINDKPNIAQSPSKLDLDGVAPKVAPSGQKLPYKDNQPK